MSNYRTKIELLIELVKLQHTDNELDRFLDLSQDILCIVDYKGFFENVNRAFEEITGYHFKEILGQFSLCFVHPDDRYITLRKGLGLTQGKFLLANFENRFQVKSGHYKRLYWTVKTVPSQQMLYCVGRDITELKQLEAGQRRSWEYLTRWTTRKIS